MPNKACIDFKEAKKTKKNKSEIIRVSKFLEYSSLVPTSYFMGFHKILWPNFKLLSMQFQNFDEHKNKKAIFENVHNCSSIVVIYTRHVAIM